MRPLPPTLPDPSRVSRPTSAEPPRPDRERRSVRPRLVGHQIEGVMNLDHL